MSELFKLQNWLDILNEEGFWPTVTIILIGTAIIFFFLYADTLKAFREEHAERAKWFHWNKPKPRKSRRAHHNAS
jgi:uncharacterized membrane protein